MTGHTNTPWEVDGIDIRSEGLTGRQIALCQISVRGRPYNETYDEAIANAAFIVKACNAHEKLVEALNDLHVWCEREGCGDQAQIIKDAFKESGITEYRCENCDGLGEWDEGPLPARHSTQISPDYRHMVCDDCAGKGTISLTSAERATVGGEK